MVKLIVMALVILVAFVGVGFIGPTIPLITEVSAQGNATGNQTGNMTEAGSGNISGVWSTP